MKDTGDLAELAGLIHFRVGAWQDFGYAEPPSPECATIPPLGERSDSAVKAGHEAIKDIDRLITRLRLVRDQLVTELRQDEDVRLGAMPEQPDAPTPGQQQYEHQRKMHQRDLEIRQMTPEQRAAWTDQRIAELEKAAGIRPPGQED